MTPSAVELDQLTCTYAGAARPALDGISATVRVGETVGLLGPNGSGKSTLFRILATLLPPTAGTARVLGHDVAADSLAVRQALSVVFQSPALDKELTARENLVYHARLLGLPRRGLGDLADRLLEHVELGDRAGDPVKRFSGGMRRRVELAKVLMSARPVLLMDEPTVGLDPAARRQVWQLVADLRTVAEDELGQPITLLVTTHLMDDLAPGAAGCDRLLLLDAGRIIADDTPEGLRSRVAGDVVTLTPEHPDDTDRLATTLREWPDVSPESVTLGPDGIRIEHSDGPALVSRLLADRDALPVPIRQASVGRPTLEDVYLHLTGRALREA